MPLVPHVRAGTETRSRFFWRGDERRIGRVAPLHDPADLVGAGGVDEERELVEGRVDVVERLVAEGDADEDDLLAEGALDELGRRRHGGWAANQGQG